jgi:Uma2 family endonuclease
MAVAKSEKQAFIPPEEYLRTEETSPVRREYVDGKVFAMSGASRNHNTIATNIHRVFHPILKGGPCKAFLLQIKTRVLATNSFYYPDLMVACDSYEPDSVYTEEPAFITEILSRSTASIDKREKVIAYKQIPSLKEYMIVHQRRKRVELYRRIDKDTWEYFCFEDGEIEIHSIQNRIIKLSFDQIYEDIEFKKSQPHRVKESGTHYSAGEAQDENNDDWHDGDECCDDEDYY